ncbi:MAG: N-formylglutamate amidohydrolase [Paracoccaceae bacterium]
MPTTAYELTQPIKRSSCVVFASPHSGRHYSQAFLSKSVLDKRQIRSSEDAFVDVLFAAAPRFGAPLLAANYPRAYVDLNRSIDELDPALIAGVKKMSNNPRISSGLGVIPRVVSNGRSIYRGTLSRFEADQRLADIWEPYHSCLQAQLLESQSLFGTSILLDCHSMPHEAISSVSHAAAGCPDVVLGDRYGAAAEPEIVARVEAAFRNAGLVVARNAPFAGAFIAQHYGRPSRGQHVVQIEIDRSLYMNEKTVEPNGNFDELKALITQVIADVTTMGRDGVLLAAE